MSLPSMPDAADEIEGRQRRQSFPNTADWESLLKAFHTMSSTDVFRAVGSTSEGLTEESALKRLEQFGTNELKGGKKMNPFLLFLQHLFSYLLLLLMVAMVFSFISQEYIEAGVIGFIILFNATVGFLQEYKSEKTLEALKSLSAASSSVRRDGEIASVASASIVPGDVVLLEEGDIVPADLRLFQISSLEINEATLTGEAAPVHKVEHPRDNIEEALGDRANMAFSGCVVTRGRGEGVVVATGARTELGKIAQKVSKNKTSITSMQRELRKLAISLFIVGMLLGVLVLGVHRFQVDKEVSMYAISLGVAAIPESLMAVLTLAMAMGVRRMAKNGAIVRKLTALESLSMSVLMRFASLPVLIRCREGSTTDICSDKTGTLTQSKMVVVKGTSLADGPFEVSGIGYIPTGDVKQADQEASVDKAAFLDALKSSSLFGASPQQQGPLSALHHLALCSTLCNAASVVAGGDANQVKAVGDPTEIALEVFAQKLGLSRQDSGLRVQIEMMMEYPFDSVVKKMTRVYRNKLSGRSICYLKGAVEAVLQASTVVFKSNGKTEELSNDISNQVLREMRRLAGKGLRVIAVAFKEIDTFDEDLTREDIDCNMTFVGLLGIYDPPREEAKISVEQCRQAGINVRMVTGDHPATAAAIAREITILESGEDPHATTMVGQELDRMSKAQLDDLLFLPKVVSRCSPETKVNLVRALHRRGKVVAMTGDGVNDAPALKAADIGVAMGEGGRSALKLYDEEPTHANNSDVTKQTADIVLTDDNISTIVKAIEEGRRISANIQKFIVHLLTGNVAQVIALVIGLSLRDRLSEAVFPMSPLQILWLNMITISPPALSLAIEKAETDIMRKPPRRKGETLFTKEVITDIVFYGVLGGTITLVNFVLAVYLVNPVSIFNETFAGSNITLHLRENSSTLLFEDHLGIYCNQRCILDTPELCEEVYGCSLVQRARATSFSTLTLVLLINGFNCRAATKTVFEAGLFRNKFMILSFIFGVVLMIPTMYIPVLDTEYFKQRAITIEWALTVGGALLFFSLSQIYKKVKQHHINTAENRRRMLARKLSASRMHKPVGDVFRTASSHNLGSRDIGRSHAKRGGAKGGPIHVSIKVDPEIFEEEVSSPSTRSGTNDAL